MPGSVFSAGDAAVNNTEQNSLPSGGFHSSEGRQKENTKLVNMNRVTASSNPQQSRGTRGKREGLESKSGNGGQGRSP